MSCTLYCTVVTQRPEKGEKACVEVDKKFQRITFNSVSKGREDDWCLVKSVFYKEFLSCTEKTTIEEILLNIFHRIKPIQAPRLLIN